MPQIHELWGLWLINTDIQNMKFCLKTVNTGIHLRTKLHMCRVLRVEGVVT